MRLGSTHASSQSPPPPPPSYSNGSSPSNGVSKFTNGHANGSGRIENGSVQPALPPKWFGHSREEVARILIQSLTDLGYHQSARSLSKESGYELEGPEVAAFRHAVLHGEWADAEALLFGGAAQHDGSGGGVSLQGAGKRVDFREWGGGVGGLILAEGANKDEMLFWLRQQKYLELLEKKDLGRALMVLRQELTPLGHQDTNRLHHLSR